MLLGVVTLATWFMLGGSVTFMAWVAQLRMAL
jgi:hypothetical protein